MSQEKNSINRRNFLKTVAATGIGSAIASTKLLADANDPNIADPNAVKEPKPPVFPMREFGNKGFKVPCFCLGVMFNALDQFAILRKALQLGVHFWDCAYSYANGNSEVAIGKILAEQPELRKKMLITSKSGGTPEELENHLQESLKRLNTDYIDIYYIHGVGEADRLTDDVRKWSEDAKKRKLIRFFGFSTHSNMANCLLAASKLGWIDAVITTYNFRVMQDEQMQQAVEACHKAGVALVAMKIQAGRQQIETDKDKELIEYFTKKGFTEGQAKIKAVLQDKRISSACVGLGRGNIEHLVLGVDAVLDKRPLDEKDVAFLTDYARKTCDGYCSGCSQICSKATPDMPYVADVMRHLMYYNSYGDHEMARELFAQLPVTKSRLLAADYSLAEARCPNRLPIAKFIREASVKLA